MPKPECRPSPDNRWQEIPIPSCVPLSCRQDVEQAVHAAYEHGYAMAVEDAEDCAED